MPERILTDAQALALSGDTVGPGVVMPTNQAKGPYDIYRADNRMALALLAPSAMEVFLEVAVLTIGHRGGILCAAGVLTTVAPVSGQAVTDDDVNYVYLDKTGALVVNITGFPTITSAAPILPLAIVTAADGDVTVIADQRAAGLMRLCGEVGPVDLIVSVVANVVTITPSGGGIVADLPNATPSLAGTMTKEDKTRLDTMETGAEVNNISDVDAATLTDGSDADGLHVHRGVDTKRVTGTYTILVTDKEIFCNTDGGDFTVTLPVGANRLSKRIINTGSGTLTVMPDGTDLIDGVNAGKTMGKGSVYLTYETTEGWW